MWQQTLFDAGQEHGLVFQTLCGVQSHQRNGSRFVVDLVGGGNQGNLVQEVGQATLWVVFAEFLGNRDEFLEVFDSGLVLWVAAVAQQLEVSGAVEHLTQDRLDCVGWHQGLELVEQVAQLQDGAVDLWAETDGAHVCQRLANREAVLCRKVGQLGLGGVADAALWHVQDASSGQIVTRVCDRDQIGHRVFDFLALIELGAADNAVRQRCANENFFKCTGLRVGAIHDRDVAIVGALAVQFVDLVGDELSLVVSRITGETDDLFAVARVGPEVFVWAIEVVRNHRVGSAQDVLSRAVVLLEQDRLGTAEVLFEFRNVSNICATERIDRLVGVTYDSQGCRLWQCTGARVNQVWVVLCERRVNRHGQLANQRILSVVGVLIFVDQDVAELALVLRGHVWVVAE